MSHIRIDGYTVILNETLNNWKWSIELPDGVVRGVSSSLSDAYTDIREKIKTNQKTGKINE